MNELKYGDLIVIGQNSFLQIGIFKSLTQQSLQYYALSEYGYKKFKCDKFGELLENKRIVHKYEANIHGIYKYKGISYNIGDEFIEYHKGLICFTLPKKYKYYLKIDSGSLNNEEVLIYNKFKKDLSN